MAATEAAAAGASRAAKGIERAAARLRAHVLAHEAGTLLGNEESLERLLGVSRPTMRQAARVLEREGLLRVRRGNQGGYFGARPDPAFIEATLATYLQTLDARTEDLTLIATALWVETLRRAAAHPGDRASLRTQFSGALEALDRQAGFSQVLSLEQQIRRAVFDLVQSPYVELIFNVNAEFARRRFADPPSARDGTDLHRAFVAAWRKATLMEIEAIAEGDVEVAAVAAGRARHAIFERLWPRAG